MRVHCWRADFKSMYSHYGVLYSEQAGAGGGGGGIMKATTTYDKASYGDVSQQTSRTARYTIT